MYEFVQLTYTSTIYLVNADDHSRVTNKKKNSSEYHNYRNSKLPRNNKIAEGLGRL